MNHPGAPESMLFVVIGVYGLFILLAIALFVLWIMAIVDCVRREFRDPNEKLIWVLVIVLAHGLGAIIYYCIGRHKGRLPDASPKQT